MAILKLEYGNWVGKKLTVGSDYFSVGGTKDIEYLTELLVKPSKETLIEDIEKHLGVIVTPKASITVLKLLAILLTSESLGMIYCIDRQSRYGVRKIL